MNSSATLTGCDDIIKRLRETSGAIFSTAPWHAPGLGEVFDAGNRCIAICIDCDPVEEHERPVPTHDEGELIAKHIAAASPDNIAALLDEIERLHEDAERYRWLRRKFAIIPTARSASAFVPVNLPQPTHIAPDAAVELDAAIDAAMAAEQSERREG